MVLSDAKVGDVVEVFLTTENRVSCYETNKTIRGMVIGTSLYGGIKIGWKEGPTPVALFDYLSIELMDQGYKKIATFSSDAPCIIISCQHDCCNSIKV